jgi:hypothetical protein
MQEYKHFILYSVAILLGGLLFLALRWPQGIYKTFSHHAAAQKFTTFYYAGLFLVALPVLYLFFAMYFVPHFELTSMVLYLVAASSIFQVGCTFVPETGGLKTTIHKILAGLSAILLLGVLMCLLLAPTIPQSGKFFIGTSFAVMVGIVAILTFWKRTPLPLLLLQSAYFGSFFIAMLATTY